MTRPFPYALWGSVDGRPVGPYPQASLAAAARAVQKLRAEGAEDVRVTDAQGAILPNDRLDLEWTDDAAHTLIKRRRMDGR